MFRLAAACLLAAAMLAAGPAAAQLLPCQQVPQFEGPGDLNYDICVGQGNLPVGDAMTHTGLTFVVPHVLEKSGTITPTGFTFDTTVFVNYSGAPQAVGVAGSGPGATVDLYLFGQGDGATATATRQQVRRADPNYRELAQTYGARGLEETALAVALAFAPLNDKEDLLAVAGPAVESSDRRIREARQRFEQTDEYMNLKARRDGVRERLDALDAEEKRNREVLDEAGQRANVEDERAADMWNAYRDALRAMRDAAFDVRQADGDAARDAALDRQRQAADRARQLKKEAADARDEAYRSDAHRGFSEALRTYLVQGDDIDARRKVIYTELAMIDEETQKAFEAAEPDANRFRDEAFALVKEGLFGDDGFDEEDDDDFGPVQSAVNDADAVDGNDPDRIDSIIDEIDHVIVIARRPDAGDAASATQLSYAVAPLR
jgi:hypothetical protein